MLCLSVAVEMTSTNTCILTKFTFICFDFPFMYRCLMQIHSVITRKLFVTSVA